MRTLEMSTTKFVGCYRTTRRCYHCGWESEIIVLEGEELTEPNESDYCLGEEHHSRIDAENDGHSIVGIKWRNRMEFDYISLLKGAQNERFVVDI